MKNLTSILKEKKCFWRKQVRGIKSWGCREPSVLDLTAEELAELKKSPEDFEKKLEKAGEILFPAGRFDRAYPLNDCSFARGFRAVVPGKNRFYSALARKMGGNIVPDTEDFPDDGTPTLFFGSSAENRGSARLAMLQRCYSSFVAPGPGGWSLELLRYGTPRGVIFCDIQSEKSFLAHWDNSRQSMFHPAHPQDGEKLLLNGFFESHRAPKITDFDSFIRNTIAAFDCGGPSVGRDNGHVTMVPLVRCGYAYWNTGDRRFLEAFKEIFFGLIRYYQSFPGGASYISDYDFYLGSLVNCWAMLESDPVFSDEERLLGSAFLFSSFRLVERYGRTLWPLKDQLRFNHESFPALSCYWGARYFEDCYGVSAETRAWKQYAKEAFSGLISRSWRLKENSGDYQWIVGSQKLAWDLAEKGKPSSAQINLMKAIRIVCDNQGRQICYGDAEPLSGNDYKEAVYAIAQLTGDKVACEIGAWSNFYDKACLPTPGWGHYFHPAFPGPQDFRGKAWETLPLVPQIKRRFPQAENVPYDKIARRQGNCYLLFEPCSCDSHRHHDSGAILAYASGPYHILVDNGYGFDVHNTSINMSKAYSQRETGPNCHNTLIFRDRAGKIILPPEFPEKIICRGDKITVSYQVGGFLWQREILWKKAGLLITDLVVRDKGRKSAAAVECQFNGLGEDNLAAGLWTLAQKGCRAELRFTDPEGTAVSCGSYLTFGWQRVLGKKYPFASGDVRQLRRTVKLPGSGGVCFVSELSVDC